MRRIRAWLCRLWPRCVWRDDIAGCEPVALTGEIERREVEHRAAEVEARLRLIEIEARLDQRREDEPWSWSR